MASKFQQRHYEAIAEVMRPFRDACGRQITRRLARMFAQDNRSFKPERFFKACGLTVDGKYPSDCSAP